MQVKVNEKDLDAAEFLPQMELGPDDYVLLNYVLDTVFAILAHALLLCFEALTLSKLYYRRASYALQRYFLFSDRTPQAIRQETASFSKIPRHVAFVLTGAQNADSFINSILECIIWCVGVGSPEITFYERTGVLKKLNHEALAEAVSSSLSRYFKSPDEVPEIVIRCGSKVSKCSRPHLCSEDSQATASERANDSESVDSRRLETTSGGLSLNLSRNGDHPVLEITLASEEDGRPMIVSLAQEYAVSIADGQLSQSDITVNKIHEELKQRVGNEPDLLVTFGSRLDLAGFSPWLVRVTELFCLPDNNGVFHYMVFYRALQKFAKVKVNLGA